MLCVVRLAGWKRKNNVTAESAWELHYQQMVQKKEVLLGERRGSSLVHGVK